MFAAPSGYIPFGLPRDMDVAQYLTWIAGLQKNWLLPNYHAAWTTAPGLFVPGLYSLVFLKRVLSLNAVTAFHLFNLAAYICAAYALVFAYKTFCENRKQALWAFPIALACVPLASLPGLNNLLLELPHGQAVFGTSGGLVEFATVSDGFLHGLTTWPLITFGTCLLVFGIALLARYCQSHERLWLRWLGAVCFVSALIHPFEVFVIVAVATIVLLREGGPFARTFARLGFVFLPAAAGLFPYVLESERFAWVREISLANCPMPTVQPSRLLAAIGLPALVALILLLFGYPKGPDSKTLVLKTWFVTSLVLFYLPGMPFQLHLLDGFFFCTGLLLFFQVKELISGRALVRPATYLFTIIVFAWMLSPHVLFRVHAWRDGVDVSTGDVPRFDAAVAPADEPKMIAWLRDNASPSDLVLATENEAPWVATAPIHSFSSHRLFSQQPTRPGDALWRDAFYNGTLSAQAAQRFLEVLGARFVVVPDHSQAAQYLENATLRLRFGALSIYEIPGQHMRPYLDPGIVELGTGTIH